MKILIVRFKQIGDSILASPMCNTLKKSFPDAEVDYVVYEHVAPIFENHKYIDNVISISKAEQKNPFKYLAKVWKVTRKKYDIVIDIMSTPKSEVFTLFSPGAEYRIGRKKKHRGYTYTHKIEEPRDTKDKVDKFLKMLKPLEEKYDIKYDSNYIITITPEEKEYMKNKMEKAGVDFSKPVVACAINSRVPAKVYPVDNMTKVIKKLLNDLDIQIIFYYSPDEKAFAKNVHENMLENGKRIFSNIETSSIRELGMLLSNCDMFFGNEGGPRHLAQSLDVPSFAIFSPSSSKKEWLSNANDRHQGVEPYDLKENTEGMTRDEVYRLITPEYVVSKVEEMFSKYVNK
ncbi:glycosyltransferase family 9 protein [Fusobacterium perfoetens]|uniref:glycosyltransferase family 9 protein n=1 Tax=Fusobacterium perfoetens TaxID=852 RepID=UPI001F1AC559|nr:glycosyltransferase family 9 protein [Fusobacterium perfoetens]MCF2626050.1 glycosyltransferase family 9 protein [Fusobacterium perfoetens]